MALILADVGGTNARFACARDGKIDPSLTRRFENDGFATFDAALAHYLDVAAVKRVEALTIAVAGPVTGPTARLTNRDWQFDVAALSASNGGAPVHLMNDLSALGYALDHLSETGLTPVMAGAPVMGDAIQRLVVGIGTGFNVSPVLTQAGETRCALAEAGLGSMPDRVMRIMDRFLSGNSSWITCVEDVFSGPGLARLHAEATSTEAISGRDVIDRAVSGNAEARASLDIFARGLGECLQDLRLLYMPTGGIFLAGSVVRALLESPSASPFIEALKAQPTAKSSSMPPVALSLITQDEAALLGCLAYALARG